MEVEALYLPRKLERAVSYDGSRPSVVALPLRRVSLPALKKTQRLELQLLTIEYRETHGD
jgi:hypothetical protein